ncbi:hypothetical protein GSI_00453 [Ganoderma sinense ZZ0214-1]|uniref:Uncharacterized protein n=1 Tax=Ganoderma sinense ZZ0214-1 TaxID=1077348 RepID=A0A2G8SST6_9APHY|nr:hypothetical protein GSI_00453 [Ganoderma sinense ZZ0214-1]
MNVSGKRPASPLPRSFDDIVRPRILDVKKDKRPSTQTPLSDRSVEHGQEVLSFSVSLQHDLSHENINDLILGTTIRLAKEGKRLVKAPRLLSDGIAFDWTYDATACGENVKSLLSVEGIHAQDLERVLLRATPAFGGENSSPAAEERIPLDDILVGAACSQTPRTPNIGSAADPIMVDDDEEGTDGSMFHPIVSISEPSQVQNIAKDSRQDTDYLATYRMTPFKPRSSIPTDVNAAVPSGPQQADLLPLQGIHSGRRPDRELSTTRHTFRGAEPPPSGDVIQEDLSIATLDGDEEPNASVHSSPRFRQLSHYPSAAGPGKRRADYGEWKYLAEDSSDVEMELADHPSSRESSLTRSAPPQETTHGVAGLPFLPRTYDTSGLVSRQFPALASSSSRSGAGSSGSESASQRDRSSRERLYSRRPADTPRRRPHQRLDHDAEQSDENERAESAVFRPHRRLQAVDGVQLGAGNSIDLSENGSDFDVRDKVQKPAVSHRQQRSSRASTNLRKAQPSGSGRVPQHRRGASDRPIRSTRRSASPASGVATSSSEDAQDTGHQASLSSSTSPGHTVVIPKADFARGRRLLVPADPDYPITAILMRGEAHFIDQPRKTRIYRHSLPVEDDFRHVEDACLLRNDTVVIGYDKGPCQVSLITVEGDQRPCRVDLNHKAHSTVIENRSAGRAYPNRGIACLAPVAADRFLSGGHDKYVYHWKLERANHRGKNRGGYWATSERIPTEHSQPVQALAFCAWNEMVYSAAGDRVSMTNLGAIAAADPERVSGKVTQVHVHPQDPRLIALEVDHLDYQVHFYDMREGGFGRRPWLEFGYRSALPKATRASSSLSAPQPDQQGAGSSLSVFASASANGSTSRSASSTIVPKSGSRYTRGSTTNSLFARGYSDGTVLVWDYRNGAQKKVLERFQFRRPAEVVHTVLAGTDVIAYGGYSVTFWSTLATSS